MPEQYFGGAPNAFLGGMEFGAAQRARRIRENALNSLIERYGPEAADPVTALQMQTFQQNEQMNPLDVAEAQRVDAARSAMVQQHGAIAGDPAAQQRDIGLQDRDNAFRLQAARRAAAVLQMTKQNNGDLGSAFDFVQNVLPSVGFPAEQLPAMREHILTNPDSVDELVALLQDPTGASARRGAMSAPISVYDNAERKWKLIQPMADGSYAELPNLVAADTVLGEGRLRQGDERIEQGDARLRQRDVQLDQNARRLSQEEAKMRGFNAPTGFQIWETPDGVIHASPLAGSQQEQEMDKNTREAEEGDRKFIRAYETVRRDSDVVTTSATAALEYFRRADAGVLMQSLRSVAARVPGAPAHRVAALLGDLRSKIGSGALQEMRQNSPTGGALGNVSNKDIELLTDALGRLETARYPEDMRVNLERILSEYQRILDLARQDAERAQQRIQNRPRRQTPPAPSQAPGAPPPAVPDTTQRFRSTNPFATGGF